MWQRFNTILSVLVIIWTVGYFGYQAGTLIHLFVDRRRRQLCHRGAYELTSLI